MGGDELRIVRIVSLVDGYYSVKRVPNPGQRGVL